MNVFLDFFAHLEFVHISQAQQQATPRLDAAPKGHPPSPSPHWEQQQSLKNNLILEENSPSEGFCTYRQVNARHGIFPRGRERTQAAMAPPETLRSVLGALSSRLYPDLTVSERNALRRGQSSQLISFLL